MPAFYRSILRDFLSHSTESILGNLISASAREGFVELKQRQTIAWQKQIRSLKAISHDLIHSMPVAGDWNLLLEYPIPRRHKRIDAVLLAHDLIFCIEYKTEDSAHTWAARRQAEDYALDLRDFHQESRGHCIIPLAISLNAPAASLQAFKASQDYVTQPLFAGAEDASKTIELAFRTLRTDRTPTHAPTWDNSAYKPVPTIIEAAEALFAGHDVREIAHSHAGATNLSLTSETLLKIIQEAQTNHLKVVCFVTGVPGAGKTLAGLNVVHNPVLRRDGRESGVFLSGNGPLVKVVRAAIERDFKKRERQNGATRTSGTFIQNIHEFVRDSLVNSDRPPHEKVVVFDEAQRAWDAKQNFKKTQRAESEPETVLSIVDRHQDWAVLIALVGGGQEINSGEAGLSEWGRTIRDHFPDWQIAVSPEALDGDASVAGHKLFSDGVTGNIIVRKEPTLHLNVNQRAFRAEMINSWVNAVLSGKPAVARAISHELQQFPLVMTRELATARKWLREKTRGLRRCGLVASSGAMRLRAEGLELSSGFRQGNRDMYVNWFLSDPSDIRSSNQLEIAASEFECQGLELDWTGICWGGDMYYDSSQSAWVFRNLSGSKWQGCSNPVDQEYTRNTYRVLLTRAREGAIIWIPQGDAGDVTRNPIEFDATADYLSTCGLSQV